MKPLCIAAAALLAACGSLPNFGPYKMEIQQGNFVSQEMVSQLKPGMTKDQVRFVLGTPLVSDIFHADRWDYVFARKRSGSRDTERRGISVFFEDGKLTRVAGDVVPAKPGADETSDAKRAPGSRSP